MCHISKIAFSAICVSKVSVVYLFEFIVNFILTQIRYYSKAHSHQAKVAAKAKKIKGQTNNIIEYKKNIEENFRFRIHFRSV